MKPIQNFKCTICPTDRTIHKDSIKQHHSNKHPDIPFEFSMYEYVYSTIFDFECSVCQSRMEKLKRKKHRKEHLRKDPLVEVVYKKVVTKIAEKVDTRVNTRSAKNAHKWEYTSSPEEIEKCLARWSTIKDDPKWVTCKPCSCQVDRQFFAQHIFYEHPELKAEMSHIINQEEMVTEDEHQDGRGFEVNVADDDDEKSDAFLSQAFYSISVSHRELQKLLQQRRIYEHDGNFFLKNSK